MANINRVVLVGNLTRDPELRHTPSGTAVCSLRLAVNTRRKDGATGEWTEKPNYFDVTVWGNQGENCAQYLAKGRPVAIDGRLEWREWEAADEQRRQAVSVVAESVQFLDSAADGRGALALSDIGKRTVTFSAAGGAAGGSKTLSNYAADFSGDIGSRASAAKSRADTASAVLEEANNRRQSKEGVNLDEELVNMTTFQQAYNASARLIQAANDMYDTLIGMLR